MQVLQVSVQGVRPATKADLTWQEDGVTLMPYCTILVRIEPKRRCIITSHKPY